MLALWFVMLLPLLMSQTTLATHVIPGCPEKCGDIYVPYPFGINFTSGISDPNCALNSFLMLTCDDRSNPPRLLFRKNIPLHNISVEEGTISVRMDVGYNCYSKTDSMMTQSIELTDGLSVGIGLGNIPFRFSDTRNKLIAIGCDTVGVMGGFGSTRITSSGCFSSCETDVTLKGSCSGIGCCEMSAPMPKNLTALTIELVSPNNHVKAVDYNPCEFAFLVDERTFDVSVWNLSTNPYLPGTKELLTSEVVIEWVVAEETCEVAQSKNNYACGSNKCIYSENGNGYRCGCNDGFSGNPYLPGGCQDIDECKEPDKYPCHGTCKNTIGSYTCKCPFGMLGDGKDGCRHLPYAIIASSVGGTLTLLIIAFLVVTLHKTRRNQRNFLKNGGLVLKNQRVRIFKEAELVKATKNYDQSLLLGEGGFGYVYKGVLEDNTLIAVKKPKEKDNKTQINEELQQEIGILSQINHRNVVKILGLCLETKVPLLVYEFISNGTLFQHIHYNPSKALGSWKNRLRVAAETALALDYLHSLADPPIIHGDVKSTNVLLDETYTAKVSDFGASVLISPGKADIASKIQGTFGYLDPEYLMTGNLTEKSDVYSFGVVLVELLTGEKPNSRMTYGEKSNIIQYFLSSLENNDLPRVLCFDVASESEMEEIVVFAEVAKTCLHNSGLKRPSMKEVAEELSRLRKSHDNSWENHQNNEETQHLLMSGESSYSSIQIGSPHESQPEIFSATYNDVFSSDSI